ncbi:MAG: 3-phosphoglycerate dehydrogenase [Peptococcaceae bacterium]|nr:3-phosphoglycerate dehydrogenase [Peptococcaceae bacterium]
MFTIQTLNKISPKGLAQLDERVFTIDDQAVNPDAIMVRSFAMHEMVFSDSLKAIARAGAGVNNIPLDRCTEQGIVVFNTPGANANAVKELVICAILLASRRIYEGITWVRTLAPEGEQVGKLVEKGKSNFAGNEITGKTIGIIGLGAIGSLVAEAVGALGMQVVGYDPVLPAEKAAALQAKGIQLVSDLADLYAVSDYVSLHVPSLPDTKGMICAESISKMKDGVKIINMARADLINNAELKAALESGKVAYFVTDLPNAEVLTMPNTLALPHLGASTAESEENCAAMAAREVADYLQAGNITNSVNLPAVVAPWQGGKRIGIIAREDIHLDQVIAALGVTVQNQAHGVKKGVSYTLLGVAEGCSAEALAAAKEVPGVITVRCFG